MTNPEPDRPDNEPLALEGEPGIPDLAQPRRARIAWKGILAIVFAVGSLATVAGVSVHRWLNKPAAAETEARRHGERPAAAATEPRRLDMTPPPPPAASAPSYVVPAIVPDPSDDDPAEPIGVRRTGSASGDGRKAKAVAPEDAPVLLTLSRASAGRLQGPASAQDAVEGASDTLEGTRRNLQAYQQRLKGTLDSMLARQSANTTPQADEPAPAAAPTLAGAAASLFGGQLQGGGTPRTTASRIANPSLTLPKGTAFTCVLKTRVISATSGLVGCQTQRNVYGDNGRVLLIERGSHLDGEYRIGALQPGMVRIPVLWTRIRTPQGVSVDLNSPGTGPLGESGIDGYVDKRWGERVGAAMLLSVIDDSVKLIVQQQSRSDSGNTVVLPSTTGSTSQLAERVLESTINIPPLVYQNQGGIVGVYVARDVDFSSVYALRTLPR
jgi:type IV secretion system protein VirB10